MSVVPTAALTQCSYKYINKYTTQPIQNKRITHLLSCVCEKKTASAVVGGSSSSSNQDSGRNSCCSAGPTVYDAPLRSTPPGEKVRFRNVTAVIVPDGIIGEKTPHPSTIPALSPLRADDGGRGRWKSNICCFAPRTCSSLFPACSESTYNWPLIFYI